MNKQEHGQALKRAMGVYDVGRQSLALSLDVSPRTVTNWTTGSTMPSERERAAIRKLLPGYDAEGDPVEKAIRRSELIDWRQDAVLSVYKRNLHEQREEAAG